MDTDSRTCCVDSGKLVMILSDWQAPPVAFSLLYYQDKLHPKHIRKLLDFIEKYDVLF